MPLRRSAPRHDPERWFRVLHGGAYVGINFAVVARYRVRIEATHGQTLEQLDETGGLDWIELWCGFHDRDIFPSPPISVAMARDAVLAEVSAG